MRRPGSRTGSRTGPTGGSRGVRSLCDRQRSISRPHPPSRAMLCNGLRTAPSDSRTPNSRRWPWPRKRDSMRWRRALRAWHRSSRHRSRRHHLRHRDGADRVAACPTFEGDAVTTRPLPFWLRFLHAVLVLPWAITFGVVRGVRGLFRFRRALTAGKADSIVCPVGHANSLMGRWHCACGSTYLGHAFAPCPFCNLPAGKIDCAVCGLTILSPWKRPS